MDDLISRQAAIDALDVLCQEHRYKIPGKSETYSEYNEAWQDALDRAEGLIFNLPSAQPQHNVRFSDADHVWIDGKQYISLQRFGKAIKDAQPEIIRCKDCKWSDWYDAADGHRYCYCMETGVAGRTADDFCSYAERKENVQ